MLAIAAAAFAGACADSTAPSARNLDLAGVSGALNPIPVTCWIDFRGSIPYSAIVTALPGSGERPLRSLRK